MSKSINICLTFVNILSLRCRYSVGSYRGSGGDMSDAPLVKLSLTAVRKPEIERGCGEYVKGATTRGALSRAC